jgi:hypothetical protein
MINQSPTYQRLYPTWGRGNGTFRVPIENDDWNTFRDLPLPEYRSRYYLGLDIGHVNDHTALAVVHRLAPAGWNPRKDRWDRAEDSIYEVVGLKRYQLGTTYPEIVADVASIAEREPLAGSRPVLVADATGVGMPIIDQLRRACRAVTAVTLTPGTAVNQVDRMTYSVPKRDLVSTVQLLMQSDRLKVASGLTAADTLLKELRGFRVKITLSGNETFVPWREHDHDDTVLAVSLACWAGESINRPARL